MLCLWETRVQFLALCGLRSKQKMSLNNKPELACVDYLGVVPKQNQSIEITILNSMIVGMSISLWCPVSLFYFVYLQVVIKNINA